MLVRLRFPRLHPPEEHRFALSAAYRSGPCRDRASQGSGFGPRAIGQQLKRPAGTISRELSHDASAKDCYEAPSAQTSAASRRSKANAKRIKLKPGKPLLKKVKAGLKQKWSPKLISDQLKHQSIRDEDGQPLRISSQAIYTWLKRDKAKGGQWDKKLPRGGRGRKHNGTKGKRRDHLRGRRHSINERPPGAENRSRLGHWEGDTVEGSHKKSFLVTLVDRKSRYGLVGKTRSKSSAAINAVIEEMLGKLPEKLRRTGTLDNGTEFSRAIASVIFRQVA